MGSFETCLQPPCNVTLRHWAKIEWVISVTQDYRITEVVGEASVYPDTIPHYQCGALP